MSETSTAPAESGALSPALARRRLIAGIQELHQTRKAEGMTLDRIAAAMGTSSIATVRRLIKGLWKVVPQRRDIRDLCLALLADQSTTDRLLDLADMARGSGGVRPTANWGSALQLEILMELEQTAVAAHTYETFLIPGLLQTPGYASAVARATVPDVTPEGIAERVRVRQQRQRALYRAECPLRFEAFLHEGVLRAGLDSAVMSEQLGHLLDTGQRGNISIRVVPFSVGLPPAGPGVPFTLFELGATGSIAYVELVGDAVYRETPQQVQPFMSTIAALDAVALDEISSAKMIAALYV